MVRAFWICNNITDDMSNSDWISDEMHVLEPDAFVG
jgi:hypothetical protein